MKKIKITERQARLLENLNTRRVIKITESQYNRILELESELIKSEGDFTNQEKPDLFKEFIEELYNMNEENSSSKYNNLIKVMEVAGLLENNKIKRDSFNNNIEEVKHRITKGLNVMDECGSPYKAVDAMLEENNKEDEKLAKLADKIKNDSDNIKQSFKGQLSGKKDYVSPFNTDDVENTYIPPVKENDDDIEGNNTENNEMLNSVETLSFGNGIAKLKGDDGKTYLYDYSTDLSDILSGIDAPFIGGEFHQERASDTEFDNDFQPEYGDKELKAYHISNYVNSKLKNNKFTVGIGNEGFLNGDDLVQIQDKEVSEDTTTGAIANAQPIGKLELYEDTTLTSVGNIQYDTTAFSGDFFGTKKKRLKK